MCNFINNHRDDSTVKAIEKHLNSSTTPTMAVIQWLIWSNGYTRAIGVKKAMLLSYTVE